MIRFEIFRTAQVHFDIMRGFFILISLLVFVSCARERVRQETAALTLASDNMAIRQRQTRIFDTTDEILMLRSAAGVLQDIGFTIDETSPTTGVLIASANRSALNSRQIADHLLLALLGVPVGTIDTSQKIKASVVTRTIKNIKKIAVRVTFQRVVLSASGFPSKLESIDDPILYQNFFDKLSQSAFLEAHAI